MEKALSFVPKHKGTEKLCSWIKKRLSSLRREAEERKAPRGREGFAVKKEGAVQIAMIGTANSGRSLLLSTLTNAKPEVASYPLTTKRPVPGMLVVDGVEIQLVEAPAILLPSGKPTPFLARSLSLARNADALMILLDGAADPADQLNQILRIVDESGISLEERTGQIVIERSSSGGVRVVALGRFRGTFKEVRELLESVGIRHAVVKVYGTADLGNVEEAVVRETTYKRGVVVLNKAEIVGRSSAESAALMAASLGLPFVEVSAATGQGLETLTKSLLSSLNLVRIFTQRNGVTSPKPLVVPAGSSVGHVAKAIHKQLARKLRYARVWGRSVKILGQRVGRGHVLSDEDVVELFVG